MNRRSFLHKSTLAGALTLTPKFVAAQPSPNSDLRVCVIGIRSRGHALAKQVLELKGVSLAAICDVDSAQLDRVGGDLEKQGAKVQRFRDYRQVCDSENIDAIIIATPNHTHTLIALAAAMSGKHAYVEKPVSHNVMEGQLLAKAAGKYGVIIQHGFQRRSEEAWHEAYEFMKSGEIGPVTLARGLCYKRRKSIGKISKPQRPPETVDYDLWCGPREVVPVPRINFHYDWHWQFPYGNGDLGNQGPHQLDVCRWFLGDPDLPPSVTSIGARVGYRDDGDWANTQICYYDYPKPIIFEVRGLETKDYKGRNVGNIIECEGGSIAGDHTADCAAYDLEGNLIKSFKGRSLHMKTFVDACLNGKINKEHAIESGHISSSLAHLGNISWRLGRETDTSELQNPFRNEQANDALNRMITHLEDQSVSLKQYPLTLGPTLSFDPKAMKFTGTHAAEANQELSGSYREPYTLPNI